MIAFKNIKKIIFLLVFIYINNTYAGYVQEGDVYFVQMKYQDAIVRYEKEAKNAEAQWKIARANICLADMSQKEIKRSYLLKAETAARNSITFDPKLSEGHTWLAAALGGKAMFEGSKSKVLLCHEIKKELDIALKINPHDDLAYSILGTYYRALGNISWLERELAALFIGRLPSGGYSDSEAVLKKAISLSPKTVRHWYELGKLYDDWGKDDLAKDIFKKGSKLDFQVESDKKRLKEMVSYVEE